MEQWNRQMTCTHQYRLRGSSGTTVPFSGQGMCVDETANLHHPNRQNREGEQTNQQNTESSTRSLIYKDGGQTGTNGRVSMVKRREHNTIRDRATRFDRPKRVYRRQVGAFGLYLVPSDTKNGTSVFQSKMGGKTGHKRVETIDLVQNGRFTIQTAPSWGQEASFSPVTWGGPMAGGRVNGFPIYY